MRSPWLASLLAHALLATLSRAQSSFDAGLTSAPTADNFLRRWTPQGTVIGDYLYLDSGEVSQLVDGQHLQYRDSDRVNDTLSLSLAESWDPREVQLRIISKPSQPMMRQAIFTDASEGSFYIWGGKVSYSDRVPDARLWKFTPRGDGDGSWSPSVPGGDFLDLQRSEGGAYASTPDAAFHFGGVASDRSTKVRPYGPVPGYFRFNFTTETWSNHSAGPWSDSGQLLGGAAVFVPTFGPNGVVMILGGEDPSGSYLSLGNVTFMDPVTGDWHWQATQGSAPPPRRFHCAVGVESRNKTFEIFVYGGRNTASGLAFDDVHVLSLPGFVWRKAGYESSSPRDSHACVVAGDGRRQMVSFGGMDNTATWRDKDPFPQGLGVFDLTEMAWKSRYDADAVAYEAPEAVRSWYADGGLDGVEWSSVEVERLFASEDDSTEGGSGGEAGEGGGGGGETPPTGGSSEGSSPPTAAIAGGVVGGVLAVALVAGLVWFLMRRKRRAAAAAAAAAESHGDGTGPGAGTGPEAYKAQLTQLHAHEAARAEVDGTPRAKPYELTGSGPYTEVVELDATATVVNPGQHARYY